MSKQDETKITKLNTEYAKEQYAQFQKQHRQVIFKRRRMALVFGLAVVVFCFAGFQLFNDYQRLQELNEIKAENVAEAETVKADVADLKNSINLLQDDDYVTKLARSKFFYSKEGEQIYVTPENKAEDVTENPAEKSDAAQEAESLVESNQEN